jgi:hypothetical protein
MAELEAESEKIRIKVKEATGYAWDNSHFMIDDSYGYPALSIMFGGNSISVWNAKNRRSIGRLAGDEFTKEHARTLEGWADKVQELLTRCNECKQWVKEGEWKAYSYAGAVCLSCYDSEKHQWPSTMHDG